MTNEVNDAVQASDTASRFVTVFCWIIGLAYLAVGLAGVLSSDTSSTPVNLVRAIGGVAILPPVLRSIGAHFPFVTRGLVPVVFALVILPIVLAMMSKNVPRPSSPGTSAQTPVASSTLAAPAAITQNQLPAKNRFEEVPADHSLRPVQDLLNAGDVGGAIRELSTRNAVEPDDRPMKARLIAAIQIASDEQINRDPEAEYAHRVETYWLPEVRGLPSIAPQEDDDFGKLRSQMASVITNFEAGQNMKLSRAQKASHQRLRDALSAKQRALFPSMRQRYARALDARLFRRNIRVAAAGTASNTLILTGALFAFNANIEDTQKIISAAAASLRFKKVGYRWTNGLGETTTYALKVPVDGAVVKWD